MDWGAEGLLDGLDGEDRAARARLLDALHDDGATLAELRDALGDAAAAYRFSNAGAKRFKGIAEPVPVLRLRRAAEDAAA
jgi:class 3 adenylate cyclase